MICTAARGGMRSVVEAYQTDGLFERWNVILLSPHVEGTILVRLFTALKTFLIFIGLLLRRRVSLVHCHAAMKGSFWRKSLFALVAKMSGVPVVFHLHGSEMKTFVERQPKMLQRLISRVLESQSVVVVLSESWRDYVRLIAPQATIQILSNYVRLPDLSNKSDRSNQTDIEFLFLGVIGKRKGIYDLLPAFKTALSVVPELKLIIGGNGEVERAREVVAELGIADRVIFAGWINGEEKIRRLQQAQIYVLPSHNEGLPVSLLEAMSWQVPVISTRVGGIPELVRDNVDGILINAGDQNALSAALIRLAQHADLRSTMGTAGRLQVERKFSMDVVLPQLESIYSGLV